MKSPYRKSRGDSLTTTTQQQYVWVSTDLVDTILRKGVVPTNWKPRKRSRGDDWGWCRAAVVTSKKQEELRPKKENNKLEQNNNKQQHNDGVVQAPFGTYMLRKCAVTPPQNGRSSNVQPAKAPLHASPKKIPKIIHMTVTINDEEFAPVDFQGETISFSYNTAEDNKVHRANDWVKYNVPPTDLTALEQLHEPAVVYCLLKRYEIDQIYTYTGKILIALNPFRSIDNLYGEDVMRRYSQPSSTRPPPHIYAIGEDAYRSAIDSLQYSNRVENQSVLVSGESGAGKTVTTKIILQYLAVLSQTSDQSHSSNNVGIESQVLQSNPILESFGNARTVRNDNSSRFGKFMEMQFEKSGCLVSASIETYLLEKVRLISQAPGERNYHVFYELLAGLSESERRLLHLRNRTTEDFRMTCVSETFDRRDGVQDIDTYEELREALDTVGFTESEQMDLFTVVSALLFTSNLTFVEDSSNDASCLDASNISLNYAIDLLGVEPTVLNSALCTVAIEARGEILYKTLSIEQAEKAVEALIKATYGALFTHIVRKINSFITVDSGKRTGNKTASIGVLDIFGFESFEENSFEQLCINYCNEALQQQFNRFVFKLEQQEYQKEGIDWSFIAFPDNQDVLDLIEKRHDGIMSILDEQCRLQRCTDATFASAIYQKCLRHDRFEASKSMQARLSFAIHHYAGLVEYSTEFFLEKNKDELPKETTELLKSSSYPFLAMLGLDLSATSPSSALQHEQSRSRKNSRQLQRSSSSLLRDSVGTQFCSQLKVLRTRIESTSPHYVRCLKPNDDLTPHNFDALVIADQLRCAGVLEAIRVSRVGFPNRYYHNHFVQRYNLLERTAMEKCKRRRMTEREVCSTLVELLCKQVTRVLDPAKEDEEPGHTFLGIQMGKTKVFIRRRAYEALEYLRGKKLEDSATLIQSVVRMHTQKIIFELTIYAVVLIQKFYRRIEAFRIAKVLRIEKAAYIIQTTLRCYKARRELGAARYIACWCQSAFRGAIARQYCAYLFLDSKAAIIQRTWKRHVSTRAFRKLKSAVIALQNRHRSRTAFRELRRLRLEARDLSRVAAERDKYKQETERLREELEKAKQSPEKEQKPDPTPRKSKEIEALRQEVQRLQYELENAQRIESSGNGVSELAEELAKELARREEELSLLREEVATLRHRDEHSSFKSMMIDTSMRGASAHGSFVGHGSNVSKASPARSDVSLLDEDIEDDLTSMAASVQLEVSGDELRHLHTAIRQKSWRHLNQVLQQTAEPLVLINQGDKYGRTAMHLASLSLDVGIAGKLIEKGAVVNAQDDDGETPLHLAESSAMTELLLTKGKANPNIPNVDGISALHLAVQRRDVDSVRILVMNNANVNNADNIRWFTALHLIALPARNEALESQEKHTRCNIAHLLTGVYGQNPPDLNYQDSEGNSPLHYAVQLDSDDACELVNIFLEKGANPNLRNMRDQVPLHLLCHNRALRCRRNYQEIVNTFLMHGADPSAQSLTGCTPLHLSLYHKDINSSVQLVHHGAELHLVWKKPKRWEAFWKEREKKGVLALDMVEDEMELRRILAAITTPHKLAPARSHCMHCKTALRSYSRAVHCGHCSRLVCGKCSSSCLPQEYFPKAFRIKEPSSVCVPCEKVLTTRREITSNATHPTSSYGEDEDDHDRFSC